MNALVKTIGYELNLNWLSFLELTLSRLQFCCLLIALFATAFSIIYTKDLNRRLFISYQDSAQKTATMQNYYSKLLLEQGAWSSQARIQKLAGDRFHMVVPKNNEIVVVKL
ncbi:MAG: cell division protein FtsL [Gammaproteobacteria bacterium]|nr:cell division protein FtsL [Gammaproteobacteria bacterium]